MSESKVTKAELNDIVSKATSGRVEEAINAFNSITTKVLQQRIFSVALPEVYNAYKKFEGEKLIGFGREYVLPYPQGNVYNFNRNAYLPSDQNGNVTRLDKEPVAQTISNPSRKLTQVTITREELLSKMTSIDKLEQLIAQVVQDMQHDFTLFFADKLFSLIGNATFSKTINSTATDAYGAWSDFADAMAESQKYSREYVIDKTNYHNGNYTSPDDFIICMSPKVYSKYLQGVKPVVFNNKELALDAIIKKENILIIPNEQYKNDIDDETTPGTPEWKSEPYLSDSKIVVISKRAISFMTQVRKYATQFFASNDTEYIVSHIWYVLDLVKFETGFVFNSSKLCTLPSNTNKNETKTI